MKDLLKRDPGEEGGPVHGPGSVKEDTRWFTSAREFASTRIIAVSPESLGVSQPMHHHNRSKAK